MRQTARQQHDCQRRHYHSDSEGLTLNIFWISVLFILTPSIHFFSARLFIEIEVLCYVVSASILYKLRFKKSSAC